MVEAYEQDKLADNPADKTCMEKAKKEAERAAAKKKTKQRVPSSGREDPEQKRQLCWEPS